MNSTKRKATLASKAKKAGLPAQTVYNRMHNGWTEKKALSVPNGKYKKGKPKFQLKGLTTEPPKDNQLWGTEARKQKTAPYKVEPKKEQTPRSKGTHNTAIGQKPIIPLPIQKFEYPKDNMLVYVVVVAVIVVIVAMMAT